MNSHASRRRGTDGPGKKAVNLSVRADLIEEARALGTNISSVLERALEEEHRRRRAQQWREESAPAIAAWNRWVEENGLPLADHRPW